MIYLRAQKRYGPIQAYAALTPTWFAFALHQPGSKLANRYSHFDRSPAIIRCSCNRLYARVATIMRSRPRIRIGHRVPPVARVLEQLDQLFAASRRK